MTTSTSAIGLKDINCYDVDDDKIRYIRTTK